jgi:lipopolysaccharide transport system permease protein
VLWRWRSFILASAVREIRSRFSRSLLGWVWLLLPPIAMIVIYSVIFSRLMRAGGLPDLGPLTYTIFLCAGMMSWQWFCDLLTRTTGLFTNYGGLFKRAAVPWQTLLAVDALVSSFGLAVILVLFLLFLAAIGQWPGVSVLAYFPLLLLQGMFAVALGMCLAVLQVFFRDVGLALPIVLQFWFWATPIVYPMTILPESIQKLIGLNFMTPIVMGYQSALMPALGSPWRIGLLVTVLLIPLLMMAALWMLRRNWDAMRDEF